jgi:hypothetical protein
MEDDEFVRRGEDPREQTRQPWVCKGGRFEGEVEEQSSNGLRSRVHHQNQNQRERESV